MISALLIALIASQSEVINPIYRKNPVPALSDGGLVCPVSVVVPSDGGLPLQIGCDGLVEAVNAKAHSYTCTGQSAGTVGQVLAVSPDGGCLYSTPSSTEWVTAMDCDLTAQSTQALATDTTYTVCSATLTKVNSAQDAVAAAVTNGTGLVLRPIQATEWYGSHSAPVVFWDLTSVASGIRIGSAVRLRAYVTSNAASDGDNAAVFIENLTSFNGPVVYIGRAGGVAAVIVSGELNSSGVGTNQSTATSMDALFLDVPGGLYGFNWTGTMGAYSSGFPAEGAWTWAGGYFSQGGQSTTATLGPLTEWKFGFTAKRSGAGSAGYAATLKRLILEYRP